jgi:hypothetical protein
MDKVYHITVYIIFFLYALNYVTGNSRKNNIQLFNIGVLVLLTVDVLKDPYMYPDIGNYSDYLKYGVMDISGAGDNFNIGYSFLNKIYRAFSDDFIYFNILIAIFIVVVYTNEIKRYSVNPVYSLLLYTLIIYFYSYWLLRQALAIVFVFYSFRYILSRNLKKYIIVMVLAVSMHTTAIAAAPLYYLYNVKPSLRNAIISFVAVAIATFGFKSIVTMVVGAGSYYTRYFDMDGDDTTLRLISKIFFVVLYVYTLRKNCIKGLNYILLICAICGVYVYMAGSTIFGIFRLRQYFEIAEVLGLPLIIYYSRFLRGKFQRICIKTSVLAYFVIMVMTCIRFIESSNFENGYRFFFQK